MKRVRIKICGITRKEDVDAAVKAGADAVGFIVGIPRSPRNISLEKAEKLIAEVPSDVESVVVAAPTKIGDLIRYAHLHPDAVQIHEGYLSDPLIRETLPGERLIRAVKANLLAPAAAQEASKLFDAILLDSFTEGKCGGTGTVHDWTLSSKVRLSILPTPLILAGGLSPENVATAVRTVQPYGVDVSSGVESKPGIKDYQKMVNFVRNAKEVEI